MSIRIHFIAVAVLVGAGCTKPKATAENEPSETQTAVAAVEPTKSPKEFDAKVMKVIDGDTIKVVDRDFQTLLIQLNGVDAPEVPQDFGTEARDALAKRLHEKVVHVVIASRDELDRIAAEVFDGDESMNVWVIAQGYGWYNHKYDTDEAKSVAETEARSATKGLWASETPVPPWVWKNPPDDGRLYTQGNGTRYHCADCETLDGRRKPITLEEAIKNYKPCQRCKPPQK